MMEKLLIGIDFGTTKTLVSSYSKRKREAVPVRLGRGRDDIPTSAYAAEDGKFYFGDDADDRMEEKPERYCKTFKMHLGSNDPALSFRKDAR